MEGAANRERKEREKKEKEKEEREGGGSCLFGFENPDLYPFWIFETRFHFYTNCFVFPIIFNYSINSNFQVQKLKLTTPK